MNSGHSDAEMLLSTQIAYLNINPGPGGHPVNISEWIRQQKAILRHSNVPGAQDQLNAINAIETMLNDPSFGISMDEFSRWTVVDSCDHNSTTGMYASVIDPGDGSAIIGFRGTESYSSEQVTNDISRADLALLDNVLTDQQADAEEYTRYVNERYKEEYEYFDLSGHSLGGNLAEHAAVTASDEMKIGRAVSYDGPGFSDEYIAVHAEQIGKRSDYIDHYGYSWVGALLFPLPGTNYQIIDADGDGFNRHLAGNVIIEDGHVVKGERDSLAVVMSNTSKAFEKMSIGLLGISVCILVEFVNLELSVISATVDWIKDRINDLLSADAEFYVNVHGLHEAADMFDEMKTLSSNIAEEVRNIAGALRYYSPASGYLKHKLWAAAAVIENDAKTAGRLSGAVRSCAYNYTASDNSAGSILTI